MFAGKFFYEVNEQDSSLRITDAVVEDEKCLGVGIDNAPALA
jgi:hypothetical protein